MAATFDAKGRPVRHLHVWRAHEGQVLRVREGNSGDLFESATEEGDLLPPLPSDMPHLSLWRPPGDSLLRIHHRSLNGAWSWDEAGKTLTVRLIHPDAVTRRGDALAFATPWGKGTVRRPPSETGDIVMEAQLSDALSLPWPGRLRLHLPKAVGKADRLDS